MSIVPCLLSCSLPPTRASTISPASPRARKSSTRFVSPSTLYRTRLKSSCMSLSVFCVTTANQPGARRASAGVVPRMLIVSMSFYFPPHDFDKWSMLEVTCMSSLTLLNDFARSTWANILLISPRLGIVIIYIVVKRSRRASLVSSNSHFDHLGTDVVLGCMRLAGVSQHSTRHCKRLVAS
jgi:hypothetical protein